MRETYPYGPSYADCGPTPTDPSPTDPTPSGPTVEDYQAVLRYVKDVAEFEKEAKQLLTLGERLTLLWEKIPENFRKALRVPSAIREEVFNPLNPF